jgi:hypothetical protein
MAVTTTVLTATGGCTGGETKTTKDGGASDGGASDSGSRGPDGAGDLRAAVPVAIAGGTGRPRTGTWSVNYWSWGPISGDYVSGTEAQIAALHPRYLEVGGYNNDANTPDPFDNAQLDKMVAYARAVGAEPILQVPTIADVDGNVPTPETAAAMVGYANVTMGYDIKYFSIGSEPDIDVTDGLPRPTYTPSEYCATARAFVAQMKVVDSSIQIVGPELAYQYQPFDDWMTPILQDCGDLFDIVSIHRYVFPTHNTTIENAATDVATFRDLVNTVRGLVNAAGFVDKPLAVTELGMTYSPITTVLDASPGTVPSALWLADMIGSALDLDLWTLGDWAITEQTSTGLGLVGVPPGHLPNPQYYAYALFADHFGPTLLDVTATPDGVNAYASRDAAGDSTDVIVTNWNRSATLVAFDVTDLATPPTPPVFELPALSLAAVHIPDQGTASAWSYSDAQRQASTGPQPLALSAGRTGGASTGPDGGAGDAGAAVACATSVPATPTITTAGRVEGTTVRFGAGTEGTWVSYTYAATGQTLPVIAPTADGNGLSIAGGIAQTAAAGNDYVGAGLYYNSTQCMDASAFTGVAFDVAGDLGGCTLALSMLISDDLPVAEDSGRGACHGTDSTCYGPSIIVRPGPTTLRVPFSALTGGTPLYKVKASVLIGVAWQLLGATGLSSGAGCTASISIENASFY